MHGSATAILVLMTVSAAPVAIAGAGIEPENSADEKLKVVVSILPQAYFVERIGGGHVEVQVLVGPGQSPHAFEPTPRQIASLSDARVYFTVGVGFETALLPRITSMFEQLKVVDTRAGIELRAMSAGHDCAPGYSHDTHDAGHAHDHARSKADLPAEGRQDPHIWLNPRLVKIQARTVCDALIELDPAHAGDYRRDLAAFDADLGRLHAEIAAALAPLNGQEFFVFHPAFGYFADEFNLRQVAVESEGKQPTARQLAQLIDRAQAAEVKVIFVEPQFSRTSAQAVAEAIGGVVIPLDPLARDYLQNMRNTAQTIRARFHR